MNSTISNRFINTNDIQEDGSVDNSLLISGSARVVAGIVLLDAVEVQRSVHVLDAIRRRPASARRNVFSGPAQRRRGTALCPAMNFGWRAQLQFLADRNHFKFQPSCYHQLVFIKHKT